MPKANERGGIRMYPTACTSAYCGRLTCPPTCPQLRALTEFKAWVKEHDAVVDDPVWNLLFYTARK